MRGAFSTATAGRCPTTERSCTRRHRHDFVGLNQAQKFPEGVILDQRIADRTFGMDPIQVAPSAATALDVARVLKVAQDSVRVALGDAGGGRYVSDSPVRPLGDGEQYLSVIRDERPAPLGKDLVQSPGRSRVRHDPHAAVQAPLGQSAERPNWR
jgi:hypothetical protein